MILLIDNYDSFSYNLFQFVGETAPDVRVIRNDELTVEEIKSLKPDRIILSPGPGRPEDAGVIMEVAKVLGRDILILGVCLGHQAICAAFGATGTVFDWNLISKMDRPYFLAGGLDAENVREALQELNPFAVDVSSGVETEGIKDKIKMAEFVAAVRGER